MISVCIPTYNGADYIKEQVESILEQLTSDDEIVISDDGSTDNTIDLLNAINDKRIKIFHNIKDKRAEGKDTLYKVSLNVQNALLNAQGDYIYLSDQDDIWLKGRINKTIGFLKSNSPALSVCNCKIINDNHEIIFPSYFNYIKPSASIFRTILKSSYHGCCMAFNRKVLEKAFPFPEVSIGHDLWLGFVASYYGQVEFIEEPLMLYRRHNTTVTTTGFKSNNSLFFKVKYRALFISSIIKKIV